MASLSRTPKLYLVLKNLNFQRLYFMSLCFFCLLHSYPVFNYYSNLIDCGIYFCKRPLLNTLQLVEDVSDFKGDFLSTLIRRQHTHQDTHYKELRNSIKAFFI